MNKRIQILFLAGIAVLILSACGLFQSETEVPSTEDNKEYNTQAFLEDTQVTELSDLEVFATETEAEITTEETTEETIEGFVETDNHVAIEQNNIGDEKDKAESNDSEAGSIESENNTPEVEIPETENSNSDTASTENSTPENDSSSESTPPTPEDSDWKLMLVNKWNIIPEDYSVELFELANGQKIDVRIVSYLDEMIYAASLDGVYMVVVEGYRTAEAQQQLLDEKIQAYIGDGYSQEDAEAEAKKWVALPGTSEHELGSAVDINADELRCSNEDVYRWLEENAHEYGFILRYPLEKESITGITFEPWHYRYVGVEAAKEIHDSGLCLEEYLN